MSQKLEPIHFESMYPENTRAQEIDKILSYIKKGNSAQLVGLPGAGRSNLLRVLAYNHGVRKYHLQEHYVWFHFVNMDLSEMKGRSSADLVKFILISLSYSLSERKKDAEQKVVQNLLKEVIEIPDELILFQALKRAIDFLCVEKELTVVFLFDRFDAYIPSIAPSFFTNLKVLRNRAKYRFSCVFSMNRPLEEVVEQAVYAEYFEFVIGNTVYITLLDKIANDFRFSYIEKVSGKKMSEETRQEIIDLTGGHGKLSRLGAEAILAEEKPSKDLSQFLLGKKTVLAALFEIWSALTPLEQKTLLKHEEAAFAKDSYPVLAYLIQDKKNAIPLFNRALSLLPQPAGEQISYHSETNEIVQGEESLTEKLSPSEFKLLRFLVQNAGRICEKEEIIGAVWSDAKSQEGVTDQALDQIIYRLRKKIETDPNNPHHIQTIKGRGYKFTV